MSPIISVIIPLYNKENEVKRTIDSILNQTFSDFELIIVNDGSTDNSLEVVNQYTDSRIRIINQENKGLPATRNVGIRASTTDIVTFLDADDEWYPTFLETILSLREKYPAAGIYGTLFDRCVIDYPKPNKVCGLPSDDFEGYLPSYFQTYWKSGHPPFSACCAAIPKYVFDVVGYFNESARIGEDVEMWARVAMHFPIVFTMKNCSRYHLIASNKMTCDFKAFDHHPAVTYLDALTDNLLQGRNDVDDIRKTSEFLKLVTAYFNIGAGNLKRSKELLAESTSKTWILRRTVLRVLTLVPKSVGKFVIQRYAKIPLYEYYLHKNISRGTK